MPSVKRKTDMSEDQRHAIAEARRVLAPLFPGETLRLYLPRHDIDMQRTLREARNGRIARALAAGELLPTIASRERVSPSLVRKMRGRLKTDGGNLPP